MPAPIIAPVLGAIGRAVAGKAIQRGAASAIGKGLLSSEQFAAGAAKAAKLGRAASSVSRGAMFASHLLGSAVSGASTAIQNELAKSQQQQQQQPGTPPNFAGGY